MTSRPFWVILCHLQEKGRREIVEKVGDEREGQGRKRKMNENEEKEEITRASAERITNTPQSAPFLNYKIF